MMWLSGVKNTFLCEPLDADKYKLFYIRSRSLTNKTDSLSEGHIKIKQLNIKVQICHRECYLLLRASGIFSVIFFGLSIELTGMP